MPEADVKETLHNAMLLANEAKHYQKVVQYSQMAEKAGGMDDKEQGALAQSYYLMGNYAQSLAVAQKSVAQATAAGQLPDRGVLDVIVTRDPAKMLPGVDNRTLTVTKGDRPV